MVVVNKVAPYKFEASVFFASSSSACPTVFFELPFQPLSVLT